MFKSLFLKEWLKTRRIFFVLLVLIIGVGLYAVMKINAAVEARGVVQLWLRMLFKDVSGVDSLLWLPVVCGIAVAVAQAVPEMSHYRLKLTLHLPVSRDRLIATMLSIGLLELFLLFAVQLVIVMVYYSGLIFPSMLCAVVVTLLQRYLVGLIAYLLVVAIIFEGTWRRRVLLAVLSAVVIIICSLNAGVLGSCTLSMFIILMLLIPAAAVLVFGSIIRFKEGLRD